MTANPGNDAKGAKAGKVAIGLMAIVCVGAVAYLLYQHKAQAQESPAAEPAEQVQRATVVTTPATLRDFERSLAVQGNVEAKHYAMVSPRLSGVIEAIEVDEGDPVTANKTTLFKTDSVALEKSVQIARHNLKVAQCAERQAAANLEKVNVDFNKARLDYERFQRLYEKKAVTTDAFEQQQSRYEQLKAAVTLAGAQVDLAGAQAEQAAATLEIAEKDLADATMLAPITGTVSARLQEPGESGSPGMPVIRIDNTSVVEIAAFLPAQYYASVVPGQTAIKMQVSGIDLGSRVVTYRSPTIDPKLRSFEIKCLVENPPAGVAPGAMADIVVVLETRRGLGVPARAIQLRGGHSVVFVVENDVAQQKVVTTGFESNGWIELLQTDLAEGAAVITMGQYMVEQGTAVSVQQEAK